MPAPPTRMPVRAVLAPAARLDEATRKRLARFGLMPPAADVSDAGEGIADVADRGDHNTRWRRDGVGFLTPAMAAPR